MYYGADKPILNDDGAGTITKYVNGVIPAEQMKSARFAAELNKDEGNWTIDESSTSPINDGLPFFVDGTSYSPVYAVKFDLGNFDEKASTVQMKTLQDAQSPNATPQVRVEKFESGGTGFFLYTNNASSLDQDDVNFVNSLVDANTNSSWDAPTGTPALATTPSLPKFDNGSTVYTYSSTRETPYFCFADSTNENGDVIGLKFSQENADSDPSTNNKKCFSYWYKDNCATRGDDNIPNADSVKCDARTYAQAWLDDSHNYGILYLSTNIVFAGTQINGSDTTCVDAPNAFKGKTLRLGIPYVTYGRLVGTQGPDGNADEISGLCYVSDLADDEISFIRGEQMARVADIVFSDVYFKLTGSGETKAAIFSGGGVDLTQKLTVKDSKFRAMYAGAILGSVDVDKVQNITVSNVSVDGTYAGALFGYMALSSWSVKISDLSVSGLSVNGEYAGGLIGLLEDVGSGSNDVSFTNIFVDNIAADGSSTGFINGSAYAGGLIGQWKNQSTHDEQIIINNTYTKGNITAASGAKAGYLIGSLFYSHSNYTITDNYHYGIDDVSAIAGIGYIVDENFDWALSERWTNPAVNTGNSVIARNFRNTTSASVIVPDVDLCYDPSTLYCVDANGNAVYNATIADEQMKSARLAAVLNLGAANASEMVWTVKSSLGIPVNDGLPVFAEVGDAPTYPVRFSMDEFEFKAKQAQRNVLDAASSTNPAVYVSGDHTTMYLFTDNTGSLAEGDVQFVNDLVDGNESSWDAPAGTPALTLSPLPTYADGSAVYTYSSTSDIPYFCFEADATNNILNFSQEKSLSDPSTSEKQCFMYWFKDGVDDAYTYAQNWLDNNDGTITLTSDVEFAGHTAGHCNAYPNAFKGKYLTLKANDVITSVDGDTYKKISGLCYESSADDDQIGFAKISYYGGSAYLNKVTFSDVFFKLTGSNTKAGVLWIASAPILTISDINVEGANIQASLAGTIASDFGFLETVKNISVSDIDIQGDTVGGIFGKYSLSGGASQDDFNLSNIAVSVKENGSIKGSAYAGGLVGWMDPNPNRRTTIRINKTYSRGDITGGSNTAVVGYLIGALSDVSKFGYSIYANYHYGYTDASVVSGIGNMVDWNARSYSSIYLNLRNAVAGLEADGNLRLPYYSSNPAIHGSSADYYNGIVPSKQMKNARLAAVLNKMDKVWTVVENENDGLPVFVTGDDKPSVAVFLDYASFDKFADAAHKDILNDAIAAGDYQLDASSHDYDNDKDVYNIGLFTDNKGHLTQDDIDFAVSLQGETNSWVNASYALNTSEDYSSHGGLVFGYSACLGDNKYLHLACSDATDPDSPRECHLSQTQTTTPSANDYACWSDMRRELERSDNNNFASKLVLDGDIDLGGYDETNDRCNLSIEPLGSFHKGLEGNNSTIEGLCSTDRNFGFFEALYGSYDALVSVKNVKFKNIHIEGGTVGVLAEGLKRNGGSGPRYVEFSNVTIENVNLWTTLFRFFQTNIYYI